MTWIQPQRLVLCLLGVVGASWVAVGCSSGPASLSRMVRDQDAVVYQGYLDTHDGDAAAAWLAWRSQETGKPVDQLRDADAELSQTQNPFDPADLWAVQRGALVFRASCIECHGSAANGRGPGGEALMGDKDFSESKMRTALALSDGLPGKWYRTVYDGSITDRQMPDGQTAAMPPMGERLTQEQIWLALTWLASDQKIEAEVRP